MEIFVVMELDYFRYFLCYQVDTGDAAGNGRCVNGVGAVSYTHLSARLTTEECPIVNGSNVPGKIALLMMPNLLL